MKKNHLLTPGPTPLPDYVRAALGQEIIHHRTPQFQAIFKQVEEDLKFLFQTTNDVFVFASSGTGAMEATVVNCIGKDDRVIVIEGGKFGERWTELNKQIGAEVIVVPVEWGRAVAADTIQQLLEKDKTIKAVFATHCETSTGVTADIQALAAVVKQHAAVLVVDAISSLGAIDLQMDVWNIDVVVSGSQKGLMLPPGLGFIGLSKKAWALVEKCENPRYYFDLRLAKKALAKGDTAFTPAITLIIALAQVLQHMRQEGLQTVFSRHRTLANATRQAMKAIGLELLAPAAASDAVTAVKVPEGIDGAKLVKTMRDEYGVAIAGGQAQLKGKIFRIAHMGFISKDDLLLCFKTLEEVLMKMGYTLEARSSVKAAEQILR